jgi:hypothetical protein
MKIPASSGDVSSLPGERRDSMPAQPAFAPVAHRATRRIIVALLVLATVAYYFWTAMLAPGGAPRIHGRESDHFNLLSRGFKKGQLHLDCEVPAGLLNARNPYDPVSRGNVAVLHDASYFRGKYYIYFGPAPVVTLLLPFRIITGRDLPLPYAVWFFSSAGYGALVGIFFFLQRRYFPRASLWTILASLIALGGASMAIALLRRPHIWELPAASGFCFFAISLLCLIRALHSPRAILWAAAGGLALGAAVASRPTYIVCSVMFAVPVLVRSRLWRRAGGQDRWKSGTTYDWRSLFAAAIGCGIPVLGLLAYNYARFENPLEFGQRYQLSSIIEGDARHFSLGYVPFNFHLYFLSPLRWLPHFPFNHGVLIPTIPPRHAGHEYTFGLLTNLPFSLFAFVSLACLLIPRLRTSRPPEFSISLGAVAIAAAVSTALLLCYFGCCIRYMVEFTPCGMLLASFGLLESEARLRSGIARNVLGAFGFLLALFSAFVAAMSVVNFYDEATGGPPRPYRAVARALNRPVFWLEQKRWPDYGPLEIALTLPVDRARRQENLLTISRHGRPTAAVLIDYLSAEKIRLGYLEQDAGGPIAFSPGVSVPSGGQQSFQLSIGGPYADFEGRKSRLRVQLGDLPFWDETIVSFGAYPGKINVAPGSGLAGSMAARFSGVIHSVRSIVMPEIPRPKLGGIRARITLAPGMVGRAFPLVTTGHPKAGDLFFVRVHPNDTISFGYDHWGDELLTSPEVPVRTGETCVVEFWIPGVAPLSGQPMLVVKVNGATVWARPAPGFPLTPETVFLGKNPIGGSTCEPMLENGEFEDVQLPPPGRAEN